MILTYLTSDYVWFLAEFYLNAKTKSENKIGGQYVNFKFS